MCNHCKHTFGVDFLSLDVRPVGEFISPSSKDVRCTKAFISRYFTQYS